MIEDDKNKEHLTDLFEKGIIDEDETIIQKHID